MNTLKHTPGPWEVRDHFLGPFIVAQHPGGSAEQPHAIVIAQTNAAQLGAFYTHHAAGNAALIAVAPDMLEALRAFIVATDNVPDTATAIISARRTAIAILSRV